MCKICSVFILSIKNLKMHPASAGVRACEASMMNSPDGEVALLNRGKRRN